MTASVPWYLDVVLYEVYVRGLYDSNGDGIGDLVGLTQKLEYSLGAHSFFWLTEPCLNTG